jgi:membrane protein YqaA with SNARE-associated domain
LSLSLISAAGLWRWLHRLGGPGLIGVGILDGSPVPVPGGTDVFLIVLASHRDAWWPFYALMGTLGTVIGGYLTYSLAAKGEKETLEKRIGKRTAAKLYSRFKAHGFATVFTGVLLPPPFPAFPVILTAGALHYPRKNFLAALGLGRAVRYFILAFAAHIYGRALLRTLANYYKPFLYALIAAAVLGTVGALVYFKWYRPTHRPQHA